MEQSKYPPVDAKTVRSLMAKYRVTIRECAACFDLTLKQVRTARTVGGHFDWNDIIRGTAQIKFGAQA